MRTIVIYASKHGTAKEYANAFGEKGNLKVIDIKNWKHEKCESYDNIVMFASVYFNKAKGVKELLKHVKEDAKISIISVGVSGYDDKALQASIRKQFNGRKNPVEINHLRGQVDKVNLNLMERLIVNMVAKSKYKEDSSSIDYDKIFSNQKSNLDFDKLEYILKHLG